MKVISASALARILDLYPTVIANRKGAKKWIGRVELGGVTYYRIEYAKKLACNLKYMNEAEKREVFEKIDNYTP